MLKDKKGRYGYGKELNDLSKHHIVMTEKNSEKSGVPLFWFVNPATATKKDRTKALEFDKENYEIFHEHIIENYKDINI